MSDVTLLQFRLEVPEDSLLVPNSIVEQRPALVSTGSCARMSCFQFFQARLALKWVFC